MEAFEKFFMFLIFCVPLTGALCFSIKMLLIETVRFRSLKLPKNDKLIYIFKLSMIIFSILFTTSVIIFCILHFYFFQVLEAIHPICVAFGLVALLTYYFSFFGFAYVMGVVVGVSGVSTRKILKELLSKNPCIDSLVEPNTKKA